tara:strand:- start:1243 stop:1440 length:198 start_codon:yes stop_codon:yes gene_type:complete
MFNIKTKEINASWSEEGMKISVDVQVNKWLDANAERILEIVDIKYHTQMTDNNSESSVLVIYKTK